MDNKRKTFTRPKGWEKDLDRTHFKNLWKKKSEEELEQEELERKKEKARKGKFSGLMNLLFKDK